MSGLIQSYTQNLIFNDFLWCPTIALLWKVWNNHYSTNFTDSIWWLCFIARESHRKKTSPKIYTDTNRCVSSYYKEKRTGYKEPVQQQYIIIHFYKNQSPFVVEPQDGILCPAFSYNRYSTQNYQN